MNLLAQVRLLRAQCEQGELTFPQFLERSAQALAVAVGCSRSAIWVFEDTFHGRRLRCLAMFDVEKARIVGVPDETGSAVQNYFHAIKEYGCVDAQDARSHPATAALFSRQDDDGVRSLMGAPLSMNGETYGTVVCTSIKTQSHWTAAQVAELRLASSQLSLVIASSLRDATLTQPAPLTTVTPAAAALYSEQLGSSRPFERIVLK